MLEKLDLLLAGEEVDGFLGEYCDGVGELVAEKPVLKKGHQVEVMRRKIWKSVKFRRNFSYLKSCRFTVHDLFVSPNGGHDAIAFLKRIIVLVFWLL